MTDGMPLAKDMADSTPFAHNVLTKAEWQDILFASRLKRSSLLQLKATWPLNQQRIHVHRNMPFEYVASACPPFLAYANLAVDFVIGTYDDSLGFNEHQAADCEFVWLDFTRYAQMIETDLMNWLMQRLTDLRQRSRAPILIADGGGLSNKGNALLKAAISALPAVYVLPRSAMEAQLGAQWVDTRFQKIGSITMSDQATLITAQQLSLVWIPALLHPPIKGIVLDLDNTLYHGVLGEDGASGLVLTEAHKRLHQTILDYKKQGVFIAALSKNTVDDVREMFSKRPDFPLQWSDFSAHSIGWNDKASGLSDIATQLRIHPNSLLVIDDNPGELAQISAHHPSTSFIHAHDPESVTRCLALYPGLMRLHTTTTDTLRLADLMADTARQAEHANTENKEAYLASLNIMLTYCINPMDLRSRIFDLSNKTNQFILTYLRPNEVDVDARLKNNGNLTISIGLKDRLSDSGVIGILFFSQQGDQLSLDELCVSCRALGRGIETSMILAALLKALDSKACATLRISYKKGERNEPALQWLAEFMGSPLASPQGEIILTRHDLHIRHRQQPITHCWGKNDAKNTITE